MSDERDAKERMGDKIEALAEEVRQLRFNAERDRAFIDRLQAERNRRVELTELGKLSEELEEENWGTAASLVRSAMHELEDLRAHRDAPQQGKTP